MRKFHVTNESTEDTFGVTDDIEEAVRIAKDVAAAGKPGDLVLIESEGKGVRQFVLAEDGHVAEYRITE